LFEATEESSLLLYEEVQRFRRSMANAAHHAKRIFKNFNDPSGDNAIFIEKDDIIEGLFDEIIRKNKPCVTNL